MILKNINLARKNKDPNIKALDIYNLMVFNLVFSSEDFFIN